MSRPEFGIPPLMITAKHQSWRDSPGAVRALAGEFNPVVKLSEVGKAILVRYCDAVCDFDGFETLLMKYTDLLLFHEPNAHKELLSISDQVAEYYLMQTYFIAIAEELKKDRGLDPNRRKDTARV